MTDENVETAEGTEEVKPKGRPRPAATLELDAKVAEAITAAGDAGVTKEALANQLEVKSNKIYLAIYRLHKEDQIHRIREGRTTLWKSGSKPATEEPAEMPVEV
jgi:hypothetical protein